MRLKLILLSLLGILSVLAGAGGLRQIVVLHLPLMMAAAAWVLINWENCADNFMVYVKKYCGCIGFIFVASFLGYLINSKVLTKIYHFKSWEDIKYKDFILDSLVGVMNGVLHSFGYISGKVLSFTTVLNGFCFVWLLLMIWGLYRGISKKFKPSQENQLLSLYLFSALIVFVGLYTFTDLSYADRYNLPILVLSIPVVSINIKELDCKKHLKQLGCVLLVVGATVCSLFRYHEYMKIDKTKELREISGYLSGANIPTGYATFWNANILTELSDGYIEVYSWRATDNNGKNMADLKDINQIYKWLQITLHETERPHGRIFTLFKKNEYEACPLKLFFEKTEPSYSTDNYILFCFDSYDALLYLSTDYSFDFSNNQWLSNGEDRDTVRYINKDGISFGPYITLYPGVYEVSISGSDLDIADFSCVSNGKNVESISDFKNNGNQVTYRIYLEETVNDVETRIHNHNAKPVSINAIKILRDRS